MQIMCRMPIRKFEYFPQKKNLCSISHIKSFGELLANILGTQRNILKHTKKYFEAHQEIGWGTQRRSTHIFFPPAHSIKIPSERIVCTRKTHILSIIAILLQKNSLRRTFSADLPSSSSLSLSPTQDTRHKTQF